ncbi:glycosyltransferase family 2 protein [Jhaorihella thermophila]
MGDGTAAIDAVVIGRNEGDRLVACLASLRGCVRRVIYVDSGSTDGSVQAARAAGAEVVELDLSRPFTAARARNAGLARIYGSGAAYVQLIDGDCTVDPDWIATAGAFLEARPDVAVACGRRRERHPEASVYNRLCDREWNTPPGEALACGGDALMRLRALELVGGFDPALIAGEEPELCQRLRRAGWTIWRLDAEMTCHDADMHRFGQWWRRSRRAGYAFAEGAQLHGRGPDRFWRRETLRALSWGAALPLLTLGLALFHQSLGAVAAACLPGPGCPPRPARWRWARSMGGGIFFTVLGRFPEAQGALEYHIRRLIGHRRGILEYK